MVRELKSRGFTALGREQQALFLLAPPHVPPEALLHCALAGALWAFKTVTFAMKLPVIRYVFLMLLIVSISDFFAKFVGRTVSGLPNESPDFALLPAHFIEKTESVSRALALCWPSIPAGLERVLEMCLAALVYHHDFLSIFCTFQTRLIFI